jgi:hypothetical protein
MLKDEQSMTDKILYIFLLGSEGGVGLVPKHGCLPYVSILHIP